MNLEELDIETSEIDAVNLKCYNEIAIEYGDLSHETCRDFDSGTICFLKKALKCNEVVELKNGFNYLDVGVGTGVSLDFLMPWLKEKKANIEVLDISEKMLEINKSKFGDKISEYHHTSIHNFNSEKRYDLIVGALCDPFLTKDFLLIMKKSLNDGGILLITFPTNTWSKKVRKENVFQTIFHNKDRIKHTSYSFCWSKSDLIKYAESIGLYNSYSRVVMVDDVSKLKNISTLNSNLLLTEKKVPMLLTLIFINK
jgi:2-polyprenyl-3-methyl-5-hydroxy-6-metoxy-1,4-benzoquinol methylase